MRFHMHNKTQLPLYQATHDNYDQHLKLILSFFPTGYINQARTVGMFTLSPLFEAIYIGVMPLIQSLIQCGANPHFKDKMTVSPVWAAVDSLREDIRTAANYLY